jgi:hypothetical protein
MLLLAIVNKKPSFWDKHEILVSLTTALDWEKKVAEINQLGLTRIAIFLSPINDGELRDKILQALAKTSVAEIPVVHINTKMLPEELDYLISRYHTQAFNLHSQQEYKRQYDYTPYKDKIYIENMEHYPLDEEEVKEFAGCCADLVHLYRSRIYRKGIYEPDLAILSKYKIGFNHISAFKPVKRDPLFDSPTFTKVGSCHYMTHLSDMDYLKEIPTNLFGPFMAIELENPIKEQLEVKDYIIKILQNKE